MQLTEKKTDVLFVFLFYHHQIGRWLKRGGNQRIKSIFVLLCSYFPFDCNVHVNFLLNKMMVLSSISLYYCLPPLNNRCVGCVLLMALTVAIKEPLYNDHEHWPVGIIFFLVTQHPSSSVRTDQRKDPIIYGTTATILPKKNLGNYFYYCTFLPTTTQHHHYSWPYTTVMTTSCT